MEDAVHGRALVGRVEPWSERAVEGREGVSIFGTQSQPKMTKRRVTLATAKTTAIDGGLHEGDSRRNDKMKNMQV